ncbi:SGNH/GDSL hydrolase family protein [Kribbella deserti]|uniref:SGNH/GDSL hydrolase family protein n=1 Tax=Kribbella deserti TaxID=1926257 RepID=A0ABV6QXC8_9ACTN
MNVRRVLSVFLGLTAVAAFAAPGPVTAAATDSYPENPYSEYVALGDSYSSAPLVPIVDLLSLGCLRSGSNYPKQLAEFLDVDTFRDVTCGGADTTHMTNWQKTPLGIFPPQFSALTAETDLVTVGIGGNDFGVFGTIIGTCPGLRASDPTGDPCRRHFNSTGVDTLKASIDKTQARITTVVKGIKARSPQAKIMLIGYPKIAPETGTCPTILPFADGDYRYLYAIEEYLNAAVAKAAAAGGATYVDTFGPSTGHDACAPDGQAWIQGQDTDLFRAASYHPRYEGQAAVAELTFASVVGDIPILDAAKQATWATKARHLRTKATQLAQTNPSYRNTLNKAAR